MKKSLILMFVLSALALIASCRATQPAAAPLPSPVAMLAGTPSPLMDAPTTTLPPTTAEAGFLDEQLATLGSLEQVDDYPLYTMRYYGDYARDETSARPAGRGQPWGCSLFAALGQAGNRLYGRNFDWDYSPAVLLFADPSDGYASVSMVDIAYLGFVGVEVRRLLDLPLAERRALLDAPFLPFDGMNEHGLVIGMAAVPPGEMSPDPARPTLGSLGVIRQMLDHARDVDEAVAVFQRYNVDMEGGPPVHYLIADASGRSVLVEFYRGQMALFPSERPWHLATNFLRAAVDDPAGQCPRYDTLNERLTQAQGKLAVPEAVELLQDVSQANTQWSIVYGLNSGEVTVVMDRAFDRVHTFSMSSLSVRP